MLTWLRSVIPADARERYYVIVAPVITLLASYGLLEASTVSSWTSFVLSIASLLLAIIHSTSSIRTAFYGLLAAGASVLQVYGMATDSTISTVLFIAATLLGITTAAAKTPTPISDGIITASLESQR